MKNRKENWKDRKTLTDRNRIESLLFFIIFFVTGTSVQAQQDDGILYKITGPNLKDPSYLLGTIHMLCEKDYNLQEKIEPILDEIDQLVLELDMDDPDLNASMQKLSLNQDLENKLKSLPDSQQAKINEWFIMNYQLGIDQLGIMKPFSLYSMMIPKLMQCEKVLSVELQLMNLCSKNKIDIEGLETIEFQMKIFDEIPFDEQIKWILNIIENEEKYRNQLQQLVISYREQDLEKLQELTMKSPEFQEHLDIMLYERNDNWMKPIENYISRKSTLIAVGAGHLSGDKGLLNLLRQKGYKIQEVQLNP